MPNTGWQYNPNQDLLTTLGSQSTLDGNPRISTDRGTATASSPFLSTSLQHSSDGWGSTARNITTTDLQAANTQTALLAQKQAQDNFKQQQARLTQLQKAAEKAGQDAQAKAYQQEQALTQQLNAQRTYNYGGGSQQGTGSAGSARGVSAAGRNQLNTARSDGYNLSASNYDRTYHYNNAYSADRNAALSGAYSWLGTHYVLGGEKNQVAVDCSGLVQAIYSKLGFNVPTHSAADQGQTGGRHNGNGIPGVRTSFQNLQPGDLVAWKDGSHIAIYAGNGQIIEAANTKVGTVRRSLWDSPSNVVGIHLTFADENSARGQQRR